MFSYNNKEQDSHKKGTTEKNVGNGVGLKSAQADFAPL
jgi:hypothetical protein